MKPLIQQLKEDKEHSETAVKRLQNNFDVAIDKIRV